jgi:uncharacterized protein YndB with AHSA1/START domain
LTYISISEYDRPVIDVSQQINAVRRVVGSRVLDAGEATVVTVARTYPSEIDDVWDACTNPERLPRWFLPVTGELRPGGRYQLEGNAGGEVQRCDPPKGFAATWEYDGKVSWIELRLSPTADGATLFELDHIAHVDDEFWTEFGPGAAGIGWDIGLLSLEVHLRTASTEPVETSGWTASEEGTRFMTLSSQRWYEASIAAGTDPADADAARDRVTAAYTAAPPAE